MTNLEIEMYAHHNRTKDCTFGVSAWLSLNGHHELPVAVTAFFPESEREEIEALVAKHSDYPEMAFTFTLNDAFDQRVRENIKTCERTIEALNDMGDDAVHELRRARRDLENCRKMLVD